MGVEVRKWLTCIAFDMHSDRVHSGSGDVWIVEERREEGRNGGGAHSTRGRS